MPLRTRTFLLCFAPVAVLLSLSFWTIQYLVQSRVRDGLRLSLRENHRAIARLRSKSDLQNSRFLRVVGENVSLKAGLELLLSERNPQARLTVEDQLRELGEHLGFDFMMVSGPDGQPLAGVARSGNQRSGNRLIPIGVDGIHAEAGGLLAVGDRVLQVANVPVDRGEDNLGLLAIGQFFDFSEFSTPAVLLRDGRVVQTNIPGISPGEADAAFHAANGSAAFHAANGSAAFRAANGSAVQGPCANRIECDVRLAGATWISLPMPSVSLGGGYVVRSLQNVDAAADPIRAVLERVLLMASAGGLLLAIVGSFASARSIVGPIASVVAHLRRAERTGMLPEFTATSTGIREIRELAEAFNRAAVSAREARGNLQHAHVEFVGSLANALDARDRYTAGHSQRVGNLSRATAEALGLGRTEIDRIHIGALLHDIGKIGVADSVLQKPGRLTPEEFALVKLHPEIGRRILEGVQGFAPYLPAVEFHHENWDGTGYPRGQSREQTPIDARIIHVADAYDAMTSHRPYRRGMSHGEAMRILLAHAGSQFDPNVASIFAELPIHRDRETENMEELLAAPTC